jgi:hypothetical protein
VPQALFFEGADEPLDHGDAAVLADGTPYTAIIRRRCRCLDCGQVRTEKEYA